MDGLGDDVGLNGMKGQIKCTKKLPERSSKLRNVDEDTGIWLKGKLSSTRRSEFAPRRSSSAYFRNFKIYKKKRKGKLIVQWIRRRRLWQNRLEQTRGMFFDVVIGTPGLMCVCVCVDAH